MYMYRVPGAHVHQVRGRYEREQPSFNVLGGACQLQRTLATRWAGFSGLAHRLVRRSASAKESCKKHTNKAWAEISSGSGVGTCSGTCACLLVYMYSCYLPMLRPLKKNGCFNGQLRKPRLSRFTRINTRYRGSMRWGENMETLKQVGNATALTSTAGTVSSMD